MIIHTITSPAFVFLSMSYSTMKSLDIPRSEFCLWSASEGLYEILADFEVGLLTTANVLPAVNGIFSIKSILNKLSLHKYLLSSINEKKALFNMLILEKCLKSPPPHSFNYRLLYCRRKTFKSEQKFIFGSTFITVWPQYCLTEWIVAFFTIIPLISNFCSNSLRIGGTLTSVNSLDSSIETWIWKSATICFGLMYITCSYEPRLRFKSSW